MANTSTRYVFLVDDEPIQNEMLKDYLSERFLYNFKMFSSGEEALNNMQLDPEIIVLDYHLNAHDPGAQNGVQILKEIKEKYPAVQVVMVSGQDKIQVAVDSMKYGAYDYIVKGETAFSRMENTLNRIGELHTAKSMHSSYRKGVIFLGIAFVCILILSIYLLMNGSKL